MNKFLSTFLIAIAFFACGPLPEEQEAESAVTITAPDGYAVNCASGYTRIAPHNCKGLSFTETLALTLDGVCNTLTFTTIPSNTYGVYGKLVTVWRSANVAANRSIQTDFFAQPACVSQSFSVLQTEREWVALPAATMAQNYVGDFSIRKVSGTLTVTYMGTLFACTGCTQSFIVEGYYD